MKIKIKTPELCAWCGQNPPEGSREIIYRKSSFGNFFSTNLKDSAYEFSLPICQDCARQIKEREKVEYIVFFAVLIGLIPLVFLYQNMINIAGICFGFFTALLIAAVAGTLAGRLTKKVGREDWGSFNGRFFQFKRAAFAEKFNPLNPRIDV